MSKKLLVILIALSSVVPALYGQDAPSLGEIARQNRAHKDNGSPAAAPAVSPGSSTPATPSAAPIKPQPAAGQPVAERTAEASAEAEARAKRDGELKLHFLESYENGIRMHFDQELFEKLDEITDKARSTRARLPGGFWKLHIVYAPLIQPDRGTGASEAEWTAHLDRLKRWISQRPQSITARVALAGAYLQYGWKARGNGYADKVTEEGWRLFQERADMAAQTLMDAFSLPTKDPEWYLTMQLVARAQERGKDVQAAIFEKAVAFEPDYQYFYRAQAESLLPKWGGEEGEMAAFAARMADRLGGKRGDMIYYQIATYVDCACDPEHELHGMSWPRIKSGYATVEELYGESLVNLNQLCSLAAMVGDPVYAQELFTRIGEHWDPGTWRERKNFEEVREWAKESVVVKAIEAALKTADENLHTPDGRNFDQQVAKTFAANYSSALTECLKTSGEAFLIPFDLAMRVGKDGTVEKVVLTVTTATSACLAAKVQTGLFPVPPRPSYWVKVSLQQQR